MKDRTTRGLRKYLTIGPGSDIDERSVSIRSDQAGARSGKAVYANRARDMKPVKWVCCTDSHILGLNRLKKKK